MAELIVKYLDNLRCELAHEGLGVNVFTDGPKSLQGLDENMGPTDFFAGALGTCMMTVMGIQANALKISLKGSSIKIDKELSTDSPRRIKKVKLAFYLPGGIEEKSRERLIKAAESCPVHHSLSEKLEQELAFHWGEA